MNPSSHMTPQKPYLLRAVYEWICDNNCVPHLLADVTRKNVKAPLQYANDGQIVLNLSPTAALQLHISNTEITFSGRFGGQLMKVVIPMSAVIAIYARENGEGISFMLEDEEDDANLSDTTDDIAQGATEDDNATKTPHRPHLKIIK